MGVRLHGQRIFRPNQFDVQTLYARILHHPQNTVNIFLFCHFLFITLHNFSVLILFDIQTHFFKNPASIDEKNGT